MGEHELLGEGLNAPDCRPSRCDRLDGLADIRADTKDHRGIRHQDREVLLNVDAAELTGR
jgi:hypothetical protein